MARVGPTEGPARQWLERAIAIRSLLFGFDELIVTCRGNILRLFRARLIKRLAQEPVGFVP
jgi:hypothetical protein